MKYRTRIYYSEEQKALMWDRWQKDESLHAIARLFDRSHGSIAGILSRTGGIRPRLRTRSRLSLTLSVREAISRGIAVELSIRTITVQLGRATSTINREINRNGGYARYRAAEVDQFAWDRARRPKRCKLSYNPALSRTVAAKLRLNCSPEQIAGWLKRENSGDEHNYVSHETIYRSLFIQA